MFLTHALSGTQGLRSFKNGCANSGFSSFKGSGALRLASAYDGRYAPLSVKAWSCYSGKKIYDQPWVSRSNAGVVSPIPKVAAQPAGAIWSASNLPGG